MEEAILPGISNFGPLFRASYASRAFGTREFATGAGQQRGSPSSEAAQFEKRHALSVPKSTGRRGLYKTVLVTSSCRGRPFLGRAVVRSVQIQTESPAGVLTACFATCQLTLAAA
jgi:hypothetical protein